MTRNIVIKPYSDSWKRQCEVCAHRTVHGTAWRCEATPKHRYRHVHPYCIDCRDPGQPCGPDATLFQPLKD